LRDDVYKKINVFSIRLSNFTLSFKRNTQQRENLVTDLEMLADVLIPQALHLFITHLALVSGRKRYFILYFYICGSGFSTCE